MLFACIIIGVQVGNAIDNSTVVTATASPAKVARNASQQSARHDGQSTSETDDVTTERMRKSQVKERLIKYGALMVVGTAVLITAGALVVRNVEKKSVVNVEANLEAKTHVPKRNVASDGESEGLIPQIPHKQSEQLTEEQLELLIKSQLDSQASHGRWVVARKIILILLLLSYVSVCIGIPIRKLDTVSCENGFFWEDHLPFMILFFITKAVELLFYAFDPTIQGKLSVLTFMLMFLPSFLGFADGYTDAVGIAISYACNDNRVAQQLAVTMSCSYVIGVIFLQWVVVTSLSNLDSSQAILMKLVHMDALASCVTLPTNVKWIWTAVNIARTVGEDVPQSVQQSFFLVYVKENYFMLASVAVSVGCSVKAVIDAYRRKLAGAGYERILEQQYGVGRKVEYWSRRGGRWQATIFKYDKSKPMPHLITGIKNAGGSTPGSGENEWLKFDVENMTWSDDFGHSNEPFKWLD
eukprot:gnl/MRDRNA2_/MRDRNA2_188780_c0_seq1.p1 gnl/MRDRNA2_/MRDRNA2_188780_c0~~gnl/MRDRNA2_/MRDRNA2_188780_c0_seq1.p1  ORF type:complete len:469 (-),score=64.85 gnl/MRDRNA2_/MRDRNA2_188780_c0_seq1:265-1671(-)